MSINPADYDRERQDENTRHEHVLAQIAKLMAETEKLTQETRKTTLETTLYPLVVISATTVAVMTVAKYLIS